MSGHVSPANATAEDATTSPASHFASGTSASKPPSSMRIRSRVDAPLPSVSSVMPAQSSVPGKRASGKRGLRARGGRARRRGEAHRRIGLGSSTKVIDPVEYRAALDDTETPTGPSAPKAGAAPVAPATAAAATPAIVTASRRVTPGGACVCSTRDVVRRRRCFDQHPWLAEGGGVETDAAHVTTPFPAEGAGCGQDCRDCGKAHGRTQGAPVKALMERAWARRSGCLGGECLARGGAPLT